MREWKRKRNVYRLGGFDPVPKGPPELPSLRLPVGDGLVASRVPAARRVLPAHGPVVVLEYLPLLDVVHHRERQRLPRGMALYTKVEPRSVMRGAVAPFAVGPGPQLYIGSVLLALAQVTAVEVGADRVLTQAPSIILRDLRRPARDSPSPFRGRFRGPRRGLGAGALRPGSPPGNGALDRPRRLYLLIPHLLEHGPMRERHPRRPPRPATSETRPTVDSAFISLHFTFQKRAFLKVTAASQDPCPPTSSPRDPSRPRPHPPRRPSPAAPAVSRRVA